MRELDPLIAEYAHEKQLPREAEALRTIRKIASLVKPIMRARNWHVGTLAEFYPAQPNLLGLNIDRGAKILLRLRYPGDVKQFMPLEQVVDTMLHELSHNVFGPHDNKFHALWNQLREEYEGLLRKGYTGEGFLSEGRKLGGQRIPRHEAQRIARNAAEKRRTLSAGSGQKLGGAPVRAGSDIRDVIVNAIERRTSITRGCGSDVQSDKEDKEMKAIADQAMRNGFRTKAEEDEANDQAIAQALWELVQEDEKEKYGAGYEPPSAANPTGNAGGGMRSTLRPSSSGPPPTRTALPAQVPGPVTLKRPSPTRPDSTRPLSRLVTEHSGSARSSSSTLPNSSPPPTASSQTMWECPTCTCLNPVNYLSCDACTTERPAEDFLVFVEGPPRPASTRNLKPSTPVAAARPKTWTCHMCSTVMEDKWWTCSSCATMKLSS